MAFISSMLTLSLSRNHIIEMIELRDIIQANPTEIQRLANNHAVAKNLRDAFPFPYTFEDAQHFLELASSDKLGKVFGIYHQDIFIGTGGLIPGQDVHRINAEIGYWIGEDYWGKGYATSAVKLMVEYAFEELGLLRVYACVFGFNVASMRVLEKSGFEKEAIIKSSIIKEGNVYDEYLYSVRKSS